MTLQFRYQGLSRVISGGQTGVDQGALVAAQLTGLLTGGYCPAGWKTARGPNPLLEAFNLICTPESDYPPRTHLNAAESDATLILTADAESAGTRCTLAGCVKHQKPVHLVLITRPDEVDVLIDEAAAFIKKHQVRTLNVAGNRENDGTSTHSFTVQFMIQMFARLDDDNLLIRDSDL